MQESLPKAFSITVEIDGDETSLEVSQEVMNHFFMYSALWDYKNDLTLSELDKQIFNTTLQWSRAHIVAIMSGLWLDTSEESLQSFVNIIVEPFICEQKT